MSNYTVIDDLVDPDIDQNELMRKVKKFVDECPQMPDLPPVLTVTFTEAEWKEIWGLDE